MDGQDVLTVVETGGGKTLMYLLPTVISTGTTLVVSPIKSLIDDTLDRCQKLNINACKFTGDLPKDVQDNHLLNIKQFKVVVVTPEILKEGKVVDTIMAAIQNGKVDRIVFDEAHTIISWGSTFRPIYKEVCEQLSKVTSCPKLLLSATVPGKAESELKLIFNNLTVMRASVFRENIFLDVRERTNKFYDEVKHFIDDHKEESGIIYCVLPKDVSTLHAELLKKGVECVKYHGQLSEEVNVSNHAKWLNGTCNVIVANSSFGMGIDKKNVQYVIDGRVPTSIDEYYQQCGRAGRDGLPSKCVLFYRYEDKNMLLKLFQRQGDVSEQMACVNELIHFLEDPVQCRHRSIMLFFGEAKADFVCGVTCDNCSSQGSFHITDGTSHALKVVQAVVELGVRVFTCSTLKLFLIGSQQKAIQELELENLTNFGIFDKTFVPRVLLDKFLHLLSNIGVLAEIPQKKGKSLYLQLVLGQRAHDLLALRMNVIRYEK